MIGRLTGTDGAAADQALEAVVRRYWPAVYAYVRRTGRSVHDASDLTQAFVTDVVLRRRLIHGADRAKGRVRHLLLGALRNFLHEDHRNATRQKRAPVGGRIVPLGAAEEASTAAEAGTPDDAFDAEWSRTLLQTVFTRVQEECRRDGLERHWAVFEARVVWPATRGTQPIDYETLARELDLPGAAHAANLLITVKRRFARALASEIAATVSTDEDVVQECRDVLRRIGG